MLTPPSEESSAQREALRSMCPFSFDLTGGFIYIADAAMGEDDTKRRRYLNTACIVFAAGAIEAVINERISLEVTMFGDESKRPLFEALAAMQRSVNLKDKWNLLVSVRGGRRWNSAEEPFQSYDTIITIRNELLYYKADFLDHLEPPINRIRPLLAGFGVPSGRTDETNVQWLHALLEAHDLGSWVKNKVRYDSLVSFGALPGR